MKAILWFILFLGGYTVLRAQETRQPDQPPKELPWHLLLEPYMMFANLNGNVAVGTRPVANIDENPHDLLSHLSVGAMLFAEADNTRWVVSSDMIYMKLGEDISPYDDITGGHATLKQFTWELAVLKHIKPWLSVGVAGQLNSIKTDLDVNETGNELVGNLTKAWFDPSFVVAAKLPLKGKWSVRGRGNIGGFGIGSKIYWQLQGYLDYHVSRLFQCSLGYRVIKEDYENGTGGSYFLYNVTTFGPLIRVGFNL